MSLILSPNLNKVFYEKKIDYSVVVHYMHLWIFYCYTIRSFMGRKLGTYRLWKECIKDFSQPKDIFENYTLSKKIEDMEEDREILGLLKVAKIYKELNDSYKLKNIKQIALRELFNNDL